MIQVKTHKCDICTDTISKYKCPKCLCNYCSTECYQSEKHRKCSESFYKDCFLERLKEDSKDLHGLKQIKSILSEHKLNIESEADFDEKDEYVDKMFSVLNLDSKSKYFWNMLESTEKINFLKLQSTNQLSSLITIWEPWWMHCSSELIEDETLINNLMEKLPKICHTPRIEELTQKNPSHCILFNLVNIIYGYAYISRLFNGDWRDLLIDSVHGFICISHSLQDAVFTNVSTAIHHCLAAFLCGSSAGSYFVSQNFSIMVIQDVSQIFKGPNCFRQNLFLESALSDCIHNFKLVSTAPCIYSSLEHKNLKKLALKIGKKLKFILSWVKDNPDLSDCHEQIDHEFHHNLCKIHSVTGDKSEIEDSINPKHIETTNKLVEML